MQESRDGHRDPEHQKDVLIGCRRVGDGQRAPEGVCDIVSSNHACPEEAVGRCGPRQGYLSVGEGC